jgi:6-phosphogluconolactonase (cycloisomerase 2 family)
MDGTISMFTINPGTGNLTPNTPAIIATGVQPFRILVDPTGKFAYVVNEGGTVSIYTLNEDGTLTAAGMATNVGTPVSIAITGTTQ